jgi:hypothetical protein
MLGDLLLVVTKGRRYYSQEEKLSLYVLHIQPKQCFFSRLYILIVNCSVAL